MILRPEDWARLKEVFEGARLLAADARPAFVAAACGDDEALRREVEALLASHDRANSFLESAAVPPVGDHTFMPAGRIESNASPSLQAPTTLGRYRITNKLGEGGMGVVYAAHDDRLDRRVALKMIRPGAADDRARQRLRREARVAASVNHPNVCQLYEIGEENGELFLAMELLEGESLAVKLTAGPLPCAEAVQITLAVLSALEALHRRGVVHRDLKPSNIFLTPHGVKLLDFGVARAAPQVDAATETGLTLTGAVIGTPNYMAPEQALGQMVDARTDLFAAADVLFEMLCGKPPFARDTSVSVLHAIVTEQPPALGGSPAIVGVDRVIHRALSKRAGDRYQTADAMAQDLRAALLATDTGTARTARPMTRLIVMPFRILRADPETDFLAFSLPDAIATCLSGLDSLIVRSSIVASRLAGQAADVKTIASEADVDVVLTGTLVRAGEQLRVSTQLVEAPGGTLVWSHSSQLSLGDIFRLQDDLATRIVESLSLPLTAREHRMLKHDVPASAKAYEFYLRANQLAGKLSTPSLARDLYLECLQEDPHYAPAWARLGRVYRVLGKFGDADAEQNLSRAEAAFVRALEINPDLSVAHNLYSYLEIDSGRAQDAMVRLVGRAQMRATDPQIFAGLVQACRFCGLLETSLAADEQARRFDRSIITSVSNTYFHLGDYQQALGSVHGTGEPVSSVFTLMMLSRDREALEKLRKTEAIEVATVQRWCESLRLLLEGRRVEGLAATQAILPDGYRDPESLYYVARQLIFFGSDRNGILLLARAVEEGFFCFAALARDPWLDSVRSDPAFTKILRRAESQHRDALAAFLEAGGDRLFGWNRSR